MFVRVCSGWSLGCGLVRPDLLLDWADRSGVRSVCQADYDNLYGAIELYELALQRGIRPILGAVITDINRDSHLLSPPAAGQNGGRRLSNGDRDPLPPTGRTKLIVQRLRAPRYVAIACNQAGYENLCRLVTERHMAESFDLAEAAGRFQYGLVFLVEDASLLAQLARYVEPARLRAEICDYGDDATRGRCYKLLASAAALGIEPVASHAAYFAVPGDHPLHRVLRAVVLNQLAGRVAQEELAPPGAWLAPGAQLRDRLGRYGKRPIRNAERLIEQCDLKLPLGVPHFPKVPLKDGETACARLCRLVWEGLARRYERVPPEAVPRLKHELHVITKMGFADYFLVVHEIVQFARSRNIGCVGRGSAADSLVTYCLGISDVDPIRYKLHFERFLNESRTDYPDIDLDFDWRRRDEVIRFVYEHWGADHVAMISTQHFYKARSAFRDAARALGMPTEKLNRLTGQLPYDEADNLRQAIATMPECRHFPMQDPQVARAVRIAERLAGLPRGLSVHVGGVVISRRELVCYSPIQPATKGIAITQYDMRAIEKVGLVKIDLLGHRSLAILADALDLVERNHAVRVDLSSLPPDDPDTARVLAAGRTIGCFQIESPGMRQLLQMLQAKDLQDVIHGLSLIRPGPSASGMKERFIRRKRGLEPVTYPHPAMQEALAETYGVMLYQEDVMMVAAAVAGFTMSTGDSLRKALEKPDSREQMARLKATFMQGARQRGCDEATAEHIWRLVSNFAAYSYNKAHACTYGKISYWCTYMKTHWPAEFMTGVLNNIGGYYSLAEYLEEARRLGVPILPPHVNASGMEFAAEPVAVQSVVPRRLNDRVSGVGCRGSGVEHQASDIGHRTSGIEHRVSGVGSRASGVGGRESANGDISCCPPPVVSHDLLPASPNRQLATRNPEPKTRNPAPTTRNPVVLRRIGIRVPLMQIRNLAEKTARAIVQQREQRPFANLQDLLGRVRLSVEEARALIFSGACDGLGPSRPAMLWQLSILLQGNVVGNSPPYATAGEHTSLFETPICAGNLVGNSPPYATGTLVPAAGRLVGNSPPYPGNSPPYPGNSPAYPGNSPPYPGNSPASPVSGVDLPLHLLVDYERARLMELERQYLSFSPGDHPMGVFGDALAGQDIIRSIDIGGFVGQLITVAGVIVAMRRAVTRQRELMQFVTLEDRWGLVEVILFPNVYKQLGGTFDSFGPYLVQGVVQKNLGAVVLVGRSMRRAIHPQRLTDGPQANAASGP